MSLTYSQAIQFLYGLRLFGTKLDLEGPIQLAALAGNPHASMRFIHVAGTNGKGSTCAMLESVYRRAGYRVGLFTSPHLVSFRERIQVNRELISEAEVIQLVGQAQSWLNAFTPAKHPTFFEVVTVMALVYFSSQNCDLVIWETGLGGRLDATNIVTPLASVITNIQFDHEKWLGGTLAKIAAEKAGIIKPGVPVLTAADEPEALEVIRTVAAQQGAPLTEVRMAASTPRSLPALQLPLLGEHQKINATLAMATIDALQSSVPVGDVSIRHGLEQVRWAGRLQLEHISPGRKVLLDGAHNPAGAVTLRAVLNASFPGEKPALILGILRDKDWNAICRILVPLARRVLLAPVHSLRTALPNELESVCRTLNPDIEVQACASLEEALDRCENEPFITITGSLLFVGEAEELLGLMPPSGDERSLNEWDATASGPKSVAVPQP